ncbi:hypothetical protein LIA77_11778 [Sarocladium implicatum]|nr:hypothetical protein LIA77_11778 [Sarocladium implicatum]
MDFEARKSDLRVLYDKALSYELRATRRLWAYIFKYYAQNLGWTVLVGQCPTLYPEAPKFDILIERDSDSLPLLLCLVRNRKGRKSIWSYGGLETKMYERYDAFLRQANSVALPYLMTFDGPYYRRWDCDWNGEYLGLCGLENRGHWGNGDFYSDVRGSLWRIACLFKMMEARFPPDNEVVASPYPEPETNEDTDNAYNYASESTVCGPNDDGYENAHYKVEGPSELQFKYWAQVNAHKARHCEPPSTEKSEWKAVWVKKLKKNWVVTFEDGREKKTKEDDWTKSHGRYIWYYQGQWYIAAFTSGGPDDRHKHK